MRWWPAATSDGSGGAGGCLSQAERFEIVAHELFVERGLRVARPRICPTGQKREESGVNASSIRIMRPSLSRPNSNFVSAMMMPRLRAYWLRPPCKAASEMSRRLAVILLRRESRCMRASLMFSSCPSSALVAGVKIGSGSWSDSFNPAGRLMPADFARAQIILPAGARDVAAHDALDRENFRAMDEHRAPL